jgi:hypothetical protein
MANSFWKAISYIFHPAFMPTLGVIVIISCDPFIYSSLDPDQFWIFLASFAAMTLLCTMMLPLFVSWVLLKTGRVSSLTVPTDKDRLMLIAFTELCFILAYYSIHNIPMIGRSLSFFMLGINVAMIITLIASMFTKVSLHGVGVGGILGTIIGLMYYTRMQNFPVVIAAIVLVALVDYSRFKLKAHIASDIYIGNIIGLACQTLVFIIMGK